MERSQLKSNFALILGYLNPVFNNRTPKFRFTAQTCVSVHLLAFEILPGVEK